MKDRIRYGVVGLGHIAQVAVLPAFKAARANSVLTALVTEDPKKARKLSKQYNVPMVYSYDQFDDLVRSNVVDALYICLPNSLHAEYAVRALRAGVHVLCEKPLATTIADCMRMAEAAATSGHKLMTAYRLHFEAANLRALDLCRRGKIGELKYFTSDFSFQIKGTDNIRVLRDMGGGPVWDIGIYCINAARMVFQEEPLEVFASAAWNKDDPRFKEVEESVAVTMRFPGDRLASFTVSFGAFDASRYQIYGTKGSILVEDAYEYASSRELTLKTGREKRKFKYKKADQFAPEIAYFSNCIMKGKDPEPSAIEGMSDVRVILAIYKSMSTGKPVRVREPLEHKGPNPDQKRFYEGHPEPKTVDVKGPH